MRLREKEGILGFIVFNIRNNQALWSTSQSPSERHASGDDGVERLGQRAAGPRALVRDCSRMRPAGHTGSPARREDAPGRCRRRRRLCVRMHRRARRRGAARGQYYPGVIEGRADDIILLSLGTFRVQTAGRGRAAAAAMICMRRRPGSLRR